MYAITIYDTEEHNEFIFMSGIASIKEARLLVGQLITTFHMFEIDSRARAYIYNEKGETVY